MGYLIGSMVAASMLMEVAVRPSECPARPPKARYQLAQDEVLRYVIDRQRWTQEPGQAPTFDYSIKAELRFKVLGVHAERYRLELELRILSVEPWKRFSELSKGPPAGWREGLAKATLSIPFQMSSTGSKSDELTRDRLQEIAEAQLPGKYRRTFLDLLAILGSLLPRLPNDWEDDWVAKMGAQPIGSNVCAKDFWIVRDYAYEDFKGATKQPGRTRSGRAESRASADGGFGFRSESWFKDGKVRYGRLEAKLPLESVGAIMIWRWTGELQDTYKPSRKSR